MSDNTYMDSGDYTYDLRTKDVKLSDRIDALEQRVTQLENMLLPITARGNGHAVGLGGRAGVLITRKHDAICAQHITVHHTPLLDAESGIRAMRTGNVAFVQALAASVVLDALGVNDAS